MGVIVVCSHWDTNYSYFSVSQTLPGRSYLQWVSWEEWFIEHNIHGDLLMQGSMFNTWKPMWVVLLEDGIEFYKRKADNSPKGMVPLKGSSINSPCHDFGKRMVSTF